MPKHKPRWEDRPTPEDFAAALSYLTLLFKSQAARTFVKKGLRLKPSEHVAKDILRACRLPLLNTDERHVAENVKRIHKGKSLSPILLVQGDLNRATPFVIADGYHRLCAACHVDEDAPVRAILITR